MKAVAAVLITLVLLSVNLPVSGQFGSYDGTNAPSFQGLEGRFFANELRVIGLGQRLKTLKTKLEESAKVRTVDKIISDVQNRVAALEGTGCATNQMQCGGEQRECVSELLVCDGIKDCKNGKDEDPKFCDTSPLSAGTVFTFRDSPASGYCALVHGRKEHHCRIAIQSSKRSHFYRPHLFMNGEMSCHLEDGADNPVAVWPIEMYYHSANRKWMDYSEGVFAECIFNEEDFDKADCTLSMALGTKVCGEKIMMYRER